MPFNSVTCFHYSKLWAFQTQGLNPVSVVSGIWETLASWGLGSNAWQRLLPWWSSFWQGTWRKRTVPLTALPTSSPSWSRRCGVANLGSSGLMNSNRRWESTTHSSRTTARYNSRLSLMCVTWIPLKNSWVHIRVKAPHIHFRDMIFTVQLH